MKQILSDVGFLVFWGAVYFIATIGLGSLASWDEAYYALVSKGIVQTNDWINLRFFNGPFYDKPPLYFWVTALFYKAWGISEFTTRLCSGLAGVGSVIVTYFLGKELFDRRVGLVGAGVLLSSTDFIHYARWGTLDVTHLFFFTLAIYCFLKSRAKAYYLILFWVASAAAIMTKGPVIVLAMVILFLYSLAIHDFSFLRKKEFWLGLLLAIALVLPWHVAAYFHNPALFMQDFVYKHYVARVSGGVEGHSGGYYFYIRTLINKYHPWVVLTIFSLPGIAYAWFKSREKAPYALLLIWSAVVLAFFTFLVQTKLQWYILPLNPALSITVGWLLVKVLQKLPDWWPRVLITAALLLLIPFSSVLKNDYAAGIKALAPEVQKHVASSETLYLYVYHDQPAALFYFDRHTAYIDSIPALDKYLTEKSKLYIVMPQQKYLEQKAVFDARGFKILHATEGLKENLVMMKA